MVIEKVLVIASDHEPFCVRRDKRLKEVVRDVLGDSIQVDCLNDRERLEELFVGDINYRCSC